MNIGIHQMQATNLSLADRCGDPFTVEERLVLQTQAGEITYTIQPVEPYEKQYPLEPVDYKTWLDDPEKAVFFAEVDEELAGQLRIKKYWNAYAYVDDIAVKREYRRQGVGRALMKRAIAWARERRFPGLMLETQDNNVAGCMLYASCGFKLGGFDRYLYKGLDPDTEEIALYWYLMLDEP